MEGGSSTCGMFFFNPGFLSSKFSFPPISYDCTQASFVDCHHEVLFLEHNPVDFSSELIPNRFF
jgi:hypothetical protein